MRVRQHNLVLAVELESECVLGHARRQSWERHRQPQEVRRESLSRRIREVVAWRTLAGCHCQAHRQTLASTADCQAALRVTPSSTGRFSPRLVSEGYRRSGLEGRQCSLGGQELQVGWGLPLRSVLVRSLPPVNRPQVARSTRFYGSDSLSGSSRFVGTAGRFVIDLFGERGRGGSRS